MADNLKSKQQQGVRREELRTRGERNLEFHKINNFVSNGLWSLNVEINVWPLIKHCPRHLPTASINIMPTDRFNISWSEISFLCFSIWFDWPKRPPWRESTTLTEKGISEIEKISSLLHKRTVCSLLSPGADSNGAFVASAYLQLNRRGEKSEWREERKANINVLPF